jgi:shikimate dehydrogenase
MILTAHAKLAGIVGWPVAHSLSPQLHGMWLQEHDIDGAYVPLAVAPENFARVLSALRSAGYVGVNVTVPHKEAAFAIAHEMDAAARAAGAVNVLLFHGDRLLGRNTDVQGLADSLGEAAGADGFRLATVGILGAGGAARAAILACDRLEAAGIRIVSRQLDRAETLATALRPYVRAHLTAFQWSDWPAAATGIRLLINATSAGMKSAAPLNLDLDILDGQTAICDLVYNPLATDLLKTARARRHPTIDGLGMLMYQAAPAFEAFFGVRPRVTPALRTALEQALRRAG